MAKRRIREHEYVRKYMWARHRTKPQWRRVRLGVVPGKEEAREYMVVLRWVDAIYLENRTVNLVEAKLKPTPWAVDQLKYYMRLFRETPEFSAYWDWEIKGTLVAPYIDVATLEKASEEGIRYEVFPLEGEEKEE